jgi:orotate phosphoribosyltransferase
MTDSTPNPRSALLDLLARTSFRLGNFTLSSGAKSDYYIDCRTTTLHAEGARLTGLAILDVLREHNLHPVAVGGLTLGADPVVSAVDDVCTTGASTIAANEAAREAGMRVIAAICLVEREEANGRPALEAACQGAPFIRLYTANDVRAAHIRRKQ